MRNPCSSMNISFIHWILGTWTFPARSTFILYIWESSFLSAKNNFMSLLYWYLKKFSKLCLTPNCSPLYVNKPTLIIDSKFSGFLIEVGLLFTMMKSYCAIGPNLRVILLVNSLDTGFSMNQASWIYSLFLMKFDLD